MKIGYLLGQIDNLFLFSNWLLIVWKRIRVLEILIRCLIIYPNNNVISINNDFGKLLKKNLLLTIRRRNFKKNDYNQFILCAIKLTGKVQFSSP